MAFNVTGLIAVTGTSNSETLTGTTKNEVLYGNGGNDILNGDAGNDTLFGSTGTDVLNGGTGNDQMAGGAGDDTYIVDSTRDVIAENANEGIDTAVSSVTYTLSTEVENLTLTGSGNLNATGNALANTLIGNDGNNILDGRAGADTMRGGLGNDTYIVDNVGDVVVENSGAGTDTVRSSVSYTLGANLENLVLTGSSAITGTGNGLDNALTGNGAANILDGGAGADTMAGAGGNDTYLVDQIGDVVVEALNQGTDTVVSQINYTLGANVENLTLAGAAVNGTGNELRNTLTGNDLDNVLSGGDGADTLVGAGGNDTLDGGTGNDRMTGGTGNDTYFVDSTSDVVVEAAGEGTDQVFASATYTLSANVERLTLTGTANINATGNADGNILTGNSGDNVLDGRAGADQLIGGLGNDTYVIDNAGDVITEVAGEGTDTVVSSINFTLSNTLENLTLSGSAVSAIGNDGDNVLRGNGSSNILDGRLGADTMIGGGGNDTYYVDQSGDQVVEVAGQGTDTVVSSIDYVLGENVENLTLTGSALVGTGNALANKIIGNTSNNILYGEGGNDTLEGGAGNDLLDGGTGADTLYGRGGDDTYIVDDALDRVSEAANDGTDTVRASVNFTLATNLENLTLTGGANVNATGNTVANILTGNAGDNVLDGKAGADTMVGGAGNDTYIVDNAGDILVENAGEGTDTVQTGFTYTLASNFENLVLTGTGTVNGTGNELTNSITGNSRNNVIDGRGGADVMTGGAGNDTYIVDNTGDVVVENAGEGTDTVLASANTTLSANVEYLVLTGTAAINGTGNDLDNSLTGNAANNILDGGAGADVMTGGAGDDTYYIDNAGDRVIELSGEGNDHVISSITIGSIDGIERMTLVGTGAADLIGNALDNILTGNAGDNILDGKAGADTMAGGAGNDTYVVDNVGDVVIEAADQGTDTVQTGLSYTLTSNVENLILTGSVAVNGTGNDLSNALTGNIGNNVLDGRGGADVMAGGAGDDTYIVDHAGDVVIENANEGVDTVLASVTTMLSADTENLVLTGVAAINGTGNDLDNSITGNGASNVIDGGAGADTMIGGAGDDTYYIDNVGDRVIELAGDGNDHVISSITIGSIDNVERITLVGTGAADLVGNTLDNTLTGNAGVNVLSGGDGKDTLFGGAGNDTLNGDAGDDTLWGQDGNDTINGGTGVDTINGGSGDDLVDGGDGNDGIFGGGGQDRLFGGAGNDKIFGDGGNDIIRGGSGDDLLTGGQVGGSGINGNDTFAWLRTDIVNSDGSSAGFDTITDFGAGDRLDFSGLFNGVPPTPIADLVRISDGVAGSIVSIDIDASGHYYDVAMLTGVHNLVVDDLLHQNGLIV